MDSPCRSRSRRNHATPSVRSSRSGRFNPAGCLKYGSHPSHRAARRIDLGAGQTKDVLDRWESVLTRLGSDPMGLREELDWVAKLALLESYRDRDGLDPGIGRVGGEDLSADENDARCFG